MTASLRIIAIALIAWLAGAAADRACAERLIVSVSNHRVTVTSNYVGEELVLFGSVESDGPGQPLRSLLQQAGVAGQHQELLGVAAA